MASRLIPCTDCAAQKRRLERAEFVVDGCSPEGDDGLCRISFHDPGDATPALPTDAAVSGTRRGAARAAPARAAAAAARGAGAGAGAAAAAWDGSVPAAATAVVKRIEGFFAAPYDDNGNRPGGTWTIGYGTIVDA